MKLYFYRKSIISTVETDKNRQICRFLAERQIRIGGYDMVLLGLILNLTMLQWWEKCSLLSKIKHFSQKISYRMYPQNEYLVLRVIK